MSREDLPLAAVRLMPTDVESISEEWDIETRVHLNMNAETLPQDEQYVPDKVLTIQDLRHIRSALVKADLDSMLVEDPKMVCFIFFIHVQSCSIAR